MYAEDFGYYALNLYWPPSSCNATVVSNNSFCSQYTLAGNEASNHLVAHGMWPDFGSVYNTAPVGPAYTGPDLIQSMKKLENGCLAAAEVM